jgi:hypothetical protein
MQLRIESERAIGPMQTLTGVVKDQDDASNLGTN